MRQDEQDLRQGQKIEAMGQLGGGIAHEFANLLVVIMLHADSVLTDVAETDPIRWQIEAIKKSAKQATALIRQLPTSGH